MTGFAFHGLEDPTVPDTDTQSSIPRRTGVILCKVSHRPPLLCKATSLKHPKAIKMVFRIISLHIFLSSLCRLLAAPNNASARINSIDARNAVGSWELKLRRKMPYHHTLNLRQDLKLPPKLGLPHVNHNDVNPIILCTLLFKSSL